MRNFVVAANWKMNKHPEEAGEFMKALTGQWVDVEKKKVVIFPSFLCWREVRDGIRDLPIHWGLQNAHPAESGAYTGEVSMNMLSHLGGHYVLIGHSERREYFDETSSLLADKVAAAQALDLIPMFCVGETLEQREAGKTEEVISTQLAEGLEKADFSKTIVVAYEPVWAIGTGKVATSEQAQQAHKVLRDQLKKLAGEEVSKATSILYGGSVKPANALELGQQTEIDGFLVGGASLEAESFRQIIELG